MVEVTVSNTGSVGAVVDSGGTRGSVTVKAGAQAATTIAGLNEMEHNGFSSAFIKGITVSANKAKELY